MPHAGGIDRVTRLEVVAAVEHDRALGDAGIQRVAGQAFDDGHHLDAGVQRQQGFASGRRFVLPDRCLPMQDLALQVGEVDRIAIGQQDASDTGAGQVERRRRTQSASAHDQRGGAEQPLLGLDPDLVEQDVAAVAEQLLVVHRARALEWA